LKNPRTVLIIQARMGSSRLPGKSMMALAGAPLVQRIIERLKRCKRIDEIVLAVPATEENNVLIDLAVKNQISFFAGSENDLVDRYYYAAVYAKADIVVRIPADNPTPEPSEIDRIIDFHLAYNQSGFSSNLTSFYNSGYPDGIGAEIFNFRALEEIKLRQKTPNQKEHVHLNFFDYANAIPFDESWCPVKTIQCPEEFRRPDLILDVNTKDQYDFMAKLYDYLYPLNNNFHITDIIKWYDEVYIK